ncbi:MAG: RluA family pseudouridine synthase [Myxococcales bacterium]|nr:RluA family pseudouridine synthase [Myxococcales bacterium]
MLSDARFEIPSEGERAPLERWLRRHFSEASWAQVRRAVQTGKVRVNGDLVDEPRMLLRPGSTVEVSMTAPRPRDRPRITRDMLRHLDSQIVVVAKPPGIDSVAAEPGQRHSLDQELHALLRSKHGRMPPLGVVQRLDRDTSGLLVFARTPDAREALKEQFMERTVERRYLAIAAGKVARQRIESHLAPRREGFIASTNRGGKLAITHVEPLEVLRGATLVACRLETGRRHQIRVHLAELGCPLLGDPIYGRRRKDAPRLALHAEILGFEHPTSGETLHFEEPLPEDLVALLESLR